MTTLLEEEIIEKKLPYNIQAEQMLIGSILLNSDLHAQVCEFLKADHFFEQLHQKIYNAIEIIIDKGLTASVVSITSMVEKEPAFGEIGGHEYLIKLTTMAMMIVHPRDYGLLIYDLAIKRDLIKIGQKIVKDAYDPSLESDSTKQLEAAEDMLFHLASEGSVERQFVSLKDSAYSSIESINRAMNNNDHVSGISTGLDDLDSKLSGFHNSDLVIIAGRPSMGKTAFAINFAINTAKSLMRRAGDKEPVKSVAFFSLEMSSEQIATRILSMMTQIDSTALRNGKISETHYNSLRKAASDLSEMKIFIDDTPALSINAIRSRAKKLKRTNNLGIIFIDYLQLIQTSTKLENRVLEISKITQGLKSIAKELNVPVIALSQLSRAVEQREDKRPMLSDLRESGSIEQDADIVMFVFREYYYIRGKEPKAGTSEYLEWQSRLTEFHNVAELIIAKHRNGAVGNVKLYYSDAYSAIGNLKKS